MSRFKQTLTLVGVTLVACGDPAGDGPYGTVAPTAPDSENFTWCDVRDRVLVPDCASCHQGAAPAGGLDLSGDSYANIVGVAVPSLSGVNYVTAGEADVSYLFLKMTGRQAEVGGGGNSMPIGESVDQALLDGVEAWINSGASESCEGAGTPPPPTPTPPTPTPDRTPENAPGLFCRVQDEVFTASCAFSGCHAGGDASSNLNLSAGVSYGQTVGVASVQVPSLKRIEAGDPANSYLLIKMKGHAADVGGVDSLMPLGAQEPLPAEQLQLVEDWIADGARLACGSDQTPPPEATPTVEPTEPLTTTPTPVPTPEPTPYPPVEAQTTLVIVASQGGDIHAFDSEGGAEIWTWDGEVPFSHGPVVVGEVAYAVDNAGALHRLNVADGSAAGEPTTVGAPTTDLLLAGGVIYFGLAGGGIVGVRVADPVITFDKDAPGEILGNLAVHEGFLVGATTDGRAFGLSLEQDSGWEWGGSDTLISSPPAVGNGRAFFGARKVDPEGYSLQAFDVDSGAAGWPGSMNSVVEVAPTWAANYVLATSTPGQARSFSAIEGTPRWTEALFASGANEVGAGGAAGEELFYVPLAQGGLVALEQSDGDEAWVGTTGALGAAPAVGLSGAGAEIVAVVDAEGVVTVFASESGTALAEVTVGGGAAGAAALSGVVTVTRPGGGGGYSYLQVQGVFSASCSCHVYDISGDLFLGSGASQTWEKTVNVPSSDVPSMDLVEPGSTADSYLWRKLSGTHKEVGGEGAQMPQGKPPLSTTDLEGIKGWILSGAPKD